MFDFVQIIELLKVEPGHGLIQSFLLLMIWMSSRGVKKEIGQLKEGLEGMKIHHEVRFEKIEGRITVLETAKGK
jgi:hypothetical protein